MTEEELAPFIEEMGRVLYEFDKEAARRGVAKAGNDPNTPN
jgi:hypothetical protein